MPSWKKVITSGSNASLAQISASIIPTVTGNENLLAYDSTTGGITQITQVNAGDNLGNHTATENLNMATFSVQGATHVTASGTVEANVLEIKSGSYSTFEHFQHIDVGDINVGQQTLTTLRIPGVSSISASFNYIKIMHMATDESDSRTQVMTAHAAWQRNSSGVVSGLEFSNTEEVKTPLNEVIIDPTRTTGTFDVDGNLILSVFHYNVDNAIHKLRYTVM
jgi:hypothetical protein